MMIQQPRILIVDDSAAMRNAIARTLRPLSPILEQAENGQMGFETARQNSFDLIITDVDMPVMDGFTLCKALKSNPKVNGIPVIILSSHDKESDIEHGFEIGASAYVSKTNAQQQLPQVVESLLEKASLLKKRLILVVDDSKLIVNIVEKGLRKEGFDVLSANDGKHALDILSHAIPDLIISDLNMPVMDGLTLCRTLRQHPEFSCIPFVCMSSESDRYRMRQMLQSGAATYIVKPFKPEQLIGVIKKVLR